MLNIGLPTKAQWIKVVTALGYSFVSSFLAVFTLAGGLQDSSDANVALILAGVTSGINASLYTLYITFFKKSE